MEEEAEEGKKVRIILRNNFKYNGKIISNSEDKLIIKDKFKNKVELNRKDIMVLEMV